MTHENPRAHNRFKFPFLVVCFVSGGMMAVGGAIAGLVLLVVAGALVAATSLTPIWVIARANPWWTRSRLDPLLGEDGTETSPLGDPVRAPTAERERRVKYRLALASAIGLVLAGIASIALGAVTNRWDRLVVGALSCLFFGACAWVALAALRRSV